VPAIQQTLRPRFLRFPMPSRTPRMDSRKPVDCYRAPPPAPLLRSHPRLRHPRRWGIGLFPPTSHETTADANSEGMGALEIIRIGAFAVGIHQRHLDPLGVGVLLEPFFQLIFGGGIHQLERLTSFGGLPELSNADG
jgi:hypothetical protein